MTDNLDSRVEKELPPDFKPRKRTEDNSPQLQQRVIAQDSEPSKQLGGMIQMSRIRYATNKLKNGIRATRRWVIPYIQSRMHPNSFHPLLSYLFTEWRCNIDCHYCFDFDNKMPGMTWETAKSSIDWLYTTGDRVLAIMGGEPLLRKNFILNVIDYASQKGFFVYLPTNGYLMDRNFIDDVGKAGVAAVNLAVDCIDPKPGLPKAFAEIEENFDYLVQRQPEYGYVIFFNINITSKNLDDVKQLTEIAHTNNIATDYHVNEEPQVEQNHYQHKGKGLYIRKEQWENFDNLIDWIVMKNRQGYTMVNSIKHLEEMKRFVRGTHEKWPCRAGYNGLFIKVDGSVAPCFDLSNMEKDWGTIWNPKFDKEELEEMKEHCNKHCLSTCFYTMGYYCQSIPQAFIWMLKHVRVGTR